MRDFITVASGLPRSGTSMMMNMLASGGLPVAVDNERTADEDNPKGYFELERVKEIPKVDSAVVTLTMRKHREHTAADEPFFLRVIKAAFSQRRKTLRNSLSQLGHSKGVMDAVRSGTGIDLGRRAETLSVAEFVLLSDFLGREHIEK